MRTGKKRKYEDEDPGYDDVRPHRLHRSAMHAKPSGVEYIGWDKGCKRARDDKGDERELQQHQDLPCLHQAKLQNVSRTPELQMCASHEKACNIEFAGEANMRQKESDQKAYHMHTRPQPEPRRSTRIQTMKRSPLPHTSCGEATRTQRGRRGTRAYLIYGSTIGNHKPPSKLDAKLNGTSTRKRRKRSEG